MLNVTDYGSNIVRQLIQGGSEHHRKPTDMETRGWTCQEALLPARVIHFGEADIAWRCRQTHKCEFGEIGSSGDWREFLASAARPPDEKDARRNWDLIAHYYAKQLFDQPT